MTPSSSLRAGSACGAAMLAAVVVYLNGLHNPFVYDDYRTVVGNESIQQIGNLRAIAWHDITRPVVNFSYAVDHALWGSNPIGYHLTSVALHALNVGLLFLLVRGMSAKPGRDVAAFAAAAMFAVHPMMTEAVGYVSGRSEVLCTVFFLLALLSGRRWMRSGRIGPAAATVGFWLVALATKETAAMFPVVLAAYDYLSPGADAAGTRRRFLTIHVPLIAATTLVGLLRVAVLALVEYPGQVSVHWRYLLLAVDVVRRYAFMLIVPTGQAAFHSVPGIGGIVELKAIGDLVMLGVMGALIWRWRRAEWMASYGALWFLLALVPSSALMLLDRGELMSEHRVYLASCGLFLAAGAGVRRLWIRAERSGPRARLPVGAALGLVLVAFALDTAARNAVWRDPVALWREAVDLAPAHYRPRLLLGEALQDSGLRVAALEEFQTAVRLAPQQSEGYLKVGVCLITMGRPQEARPYLLDALARDPTSEPARRALALLDRITSS